MRARIHSPVHGGRTRTYVYIPLGYSELSLKDMSDEPF